MAGYDVCIEAMPACGFIDLKGHEKIRGLCSDVLDLAVPISANRRADGNDGMAVFCIAPGHWLLQLEQDIHDHILSELEQAAEGHSHSFVDVSDMYERIQLSGSEVRDVLAQGVSLDIHPRVFPPGATARTALAKTTIQLCCISPAPKFTLRVYSSYQQYVVDWLNVSAASNLSS